MSKVQIYSTNWCPYCDAAKSLLADKGVAYDEIDVTDPTLRMEMMQRAHGRRTVPKIFVGETHIGLNDARAALPGAGRRTSPSRARRRSRAIPRCTCIWARWPWRGPTGGLPIARCC